jgi:hypothetical protein
MRKLRIRVRHEVLRNKMSREEGRTLSEEDVRRWLKEAGFTPEPDGTWLVDEPDLGQLEPEEVDHVMDV